MARKSKDNLLILKGQQIIAGSQISTEKYKEAEATVNDSLKILSENEVNSKQKAQIYLLLAWLWRSQHETEKALEFGKKALAVAPNDRQILGEYYLNIGRILFSSGYDISGIIWLEKAEKIFKTEKTNAAKLDNYRFLSLAWASKLNNQKALAYAEKRIDLSIGTQYKYKYRQALYELGNLLSATGQKQKAFAVFKKGLELSLAQENTYQSRNFLSVLLFNSLYENEVKEAASYLAQLENLDTDDQFSFDILLGKAVVAAFNGQNEVSEKSFTELDKMEKDSDFLTPLWKITIAEKQKNWEQVVNLNQFVLDITLKNNFRDDLPKLYLNFANAYFHLELTQKSLESLEKTIALVEEIRQSETPDLSLGILETYHNAYRLLTQMKTVNPEESFELADFLKARVLKDKINNSPLKTTSTISNEVRQKLEALTLKFVDDQSVSEEIEKTEKLITTKIPELNLDKPDLSKLDKISDLNDAAIISYFFTLDKKLLAFVREKGKPVKTIQLPVSEDEIDISAAKIQQNIKNQIFFKRDGQELYDKLLKPLSLTSKHLIFVPDKSLWKIPFQALSSDGEKYLIEEKLISYAPSVSILLEQLKSPKPNRQTLQAFSNSSFENKNLQFANSEASAVAGMYNSKPIINATVEDFENNSTKTDILHFSMHAQVDQEQPLDSFLGFRKIGKDDGHLTVEKLLNIKLKKGSLVFLASCDTNNVLSGEGLVSLAWAMLGSGATTVISAQWEADDRSSAIFTKSFYENYKQGNSAAESLQKSAVALIKDKSLNMHEPYYWADFALNGDYR
ncbi:MAG: CHAT domain-containing tetratricopeptide repeat protein [Actinomycetota bacterium]